MFYMYMCTIDNYHDFDVSTEVKQTRIKYLEEKTNKLLIYHSGQTLQFI